MEVMIPFKGEIEFDFNSARSSPFVSPPSTPKPFGGDYYCSAPTSPSRMSEFYCEFDNVFIADDEKDEDNEIIKDEFAFDVSQEFEKSSVSAEELFDGGMIKPLRPSPVFHQNRGEQSIENRGSIRESRGSVRENRGKQSNENRGSGRESRGKQRNDGLSSSSSRRGARSLSPMRISQYLWEDDEEEEKKSSKPSSILTSKGSKKWRFKDFFLFRSASEGRASDKDPLKKYTVACKRSSSQEEGRSSSFNKGNEIISSLNNKSIVAARRKKGQISAHELHYTVNRAVSSDLKKKTFLPYKQGILGQLAFNPAVHSLANGFGFSRK